MLQIMMLGYSPATTTAYYSALLFYSYNRPQLLSYSIRYLKSKFEKQVEKKSISKCVCVCDLTHISVI